MSSVVLNDVMAVGVQQDEVSRVAVGMIAVHGLACLTCVGAWRVVYDNEGYVIYRLP